MPLPTDGESRMIRAARLLSATAGREVRVVAAEPLTLEQSVWRCRLAGHVPGVPESVIVRTNRKLGGWRTEPTYLFNDYAASVCLSRLCPGITAKVLAADLDARVVVTEDFGTGRSLTDLLRGSSRAAAVDGLLAFARTLGRMHAATAGSDDEYYTFRRQLGLADTLPARSALNERSVPDALGQLLDTTPASGPATEELQGVLHELQNPGSLLALSSGDPCPYNCLLQDGAARLCDFELACYRHALLDVAYLYLGFHCCYEAGLIPTSILREAESVYRHEASAGVSQLSDQTVYLHGLAVAIAAWAILAATDLTRHPTDAARAARSAHTLESCVAIWRETSQLPALADWFAALGRGHEAARPRYQALPF